jgi:hypothetical protein
MSVDDAWRYGTNVWEWLVATPFVMVLAGAALLATGLYYTVRPVATPPPPGANVPTDPIIQDGRFDWDAADQVVFSGRYLRSGKHVNAYVSYANLPQKRVLGGTGPSIGPRIKIDSVDRFDKNAQASILIGRITSVEGNQQIITWGRPELGNMSVGITWGSYFGCLVLVEEGGQENHYTFAIIAAQDGLATQDRKVAPPTIVGPPLIATCPN